MKLFSKLSVYTYDVGAQKNRRDGSFEYPQHMFWFRNKKNNLESHPHPLSSDLDIDFDVATHLKKLFRSVMYRKDVSDVVLAQLLLVLGISVITHINPMDNLEQAGLNY